MHKNFYCLVVSIDMIRQIAVHHNHAQMPYHSQTTPLEWWVTRLSPHNKHAKQE